MADKKPVETMDCGFNVCPQLKVMEERRRHDGELISLIPDILTVQNRLIGGTRVVALVSMLMLCSSFIYTKDVKTDLEREQVETKASHFDMIRGLEDDIKKSEKNTNDLLTEMRNLTKAIKENYSKNTGGT